MNSKHLILALILLLDVGQLNDWFAMGSMITSPALSSPSMHLVADGGFAEIAIYRIVTILTTNHM